MRVREVFKTIQGEGRNAGRAAVFCRFSGCNLWSGREADRGSADCRFCDTDFVGGDTYQEKELMDLICETWGAGASPFVVFTGGEPGLQLTGSLIHSMRERGFNVAVESNGTIELPPGPYWRTVSPKAGAAIKQVWGNELKVVWPQPLDLRELATMDFRYFYLQPMAGVDGAVGLVVDEVMRNPKWRLSLQAHKVIGLR